MAKSNGLVMVFIVMLYMTVGTLLTSYSLNHWIPYFKGTCAIHIPWYACTLIAVPFAGLMLPAAAITFIAGFILAFPVC